MGGVKCAQIALIALKKRKTKLIFKNRQTKWHWRNAKNTVLKFFSKRFKSIYGLPYLKLKKVRILSPFLTLLSLGVLIVLKKKRKKNYKKKTNRITLSEMQKNTDLKFFLERFNSICGFPYFKLKKLRILYVFFFFLFF